MLKKIAIGFLVLIGIGMLLPKREPQPDDWKLGAVSAAQDKVRERLRDPGSAVFRNVRLIESRVDGIGAVCGEVNARNGFGGMSGFGPFRVHVERGPQNQQMMGVPLVTDQGISLSGAMAQLCQPGFDPTPPARPR